MSDRAQPAAPPADEYDSPHLDRPPALNAPVEGRRWSQYLRAHSRPFTLFFVRSYPAAVDVPHPDLKGYRDVARLILLPGEHVPRPCPIVRMEVQRKLGVGYNPDDITEYLLDRRARVALDKVRPEYHHDLGRALHGNPCCLFHCRRVVLARRPSLLDSQRVHPRRDTCPVALAQPFLEVFLRTGVSSPTDPGVLAA